MCGLLLRFDVNKKNVVILTPRPRTNEPPTNAFNFASIASVAEDNNSSKRPSKTK